MLLLRRLLKIRLARAGLLLMLPYVAAAVFAPLLAPHDPMALDLTRIAVGPSLSHLFGTDEVGRDLFSRVIWGARISLTIASLSTLGALVVGGTLGVIAGYFRGWLGTIILRSTDLLLAFPGILLAISLVSLLGPGLVSLIYALAISNVPRFIRVAWASVLSTRGREFIEAACALGAGDLRILKTHVLPNSMSPIIVETSLRFGAVVLMAAGLSFLGLGVRPPVPEWGAMMSDARAYIRSAPHIIFAPGLALMFLVFSFNLLGDSLRDALDPRL